MRPLATGRYTAADVDLALRAQHAAYSSRFEIVDRALRKVDDLDAVTAAVVDWNADRPGKGELRLTLEATTTLAPDREALIKPWFRVLMPDGGYAEFPCGVYVWYVGWPNRALGEGAPDRWTATLNDLLIWLDDAGPGLEGFALQAGTLVTDGIADAVRRAGLTDTSGIVPSNASLSGDLAWDVTDSRGRPTTWRSIVTQLHEAIGYYTPWFDGDGRYRAMPQPDLRNAHASARYGTATDGITVVPATTGTTAAKRANRVIARAQSADGSYAHAVADADVLYPTHPRRQGAIGRYIDAVIEVAATGTTILEQAAAAELGQSLSTYETVAFDALAWPVHEMFDVVGFQWDGDPEFDGEQPMHERAWSLDLMSGRHRHELRRIAGVV